MPEHFIWFIIGTVFGGCQIYFWPMVYRDWKIRKQKRLEEEIEIQNLLDKINKKPLKFIDILHQASRDLANKK